MMELTTMTKYYTQTPTEHLVVAKTETQDVYQVYLMTPKLLGEVQKQGRNATIYDGAYFPTYEDAIEALKEKNGISAERMPRKFPPKIPTWQFDGMKLVDLGVWPQFCIDRNLKGTSKDMAAKYNLTLADITKLKIKVPAK